MTSLGDGRVLLFLSSVLEVAIWRWAEGAAEPTLMRRIRKHYLEGSACPRFPLALPAASLDTYKKLNQHVATLAPAELDDLSALHTSQVEVSATTWTGGAEAATKWLVVQRYEARKTAQAVGCETVPIIGLAALLGTDDPLRGAVFCFLPVGDIATGLPVHVNGCFEVQDNRRNLWLDNASLTGGSTLSGGHLASARWNQALCTECLPQLWLELLIISRTMGRQALIALLPDLTTSQPEWVALPTALYVLLYDTPVLPHIRHGAPLWVKPSEAHVLELPSPAFRAQRDLLLRLYSEQPWTVESLLLVDVPVHMEEACLQHSGMRRLSMDLFLQWMLRSMQPHVQPLAPALFALAELADADKSLHEAWPARLAAFDWVPIANGEHVLLCNAFSPGERSLVDARLHVVDQAVAVLSCDHIQHPAAVERSVVTWGVKTELTWGDVLLEARHVEELGDLNAARRLLANRPAAALPDGNTLCHLSKVRFVPGRATLCSPSTDKPEVRLFTMRELFPHAAHSVVWAVRATVADAEVDRLLMALDPSPFSALGRLTVEVVVEQLVVLAGLGCSDAIAAHLLTAATDLALRLPNDLLARWLALQPLCEVAWLPSFLGSTLRLLPAKLLSRNWTFARANGHGRLGQPLDSWCVHTAAA